MSKLSNTILMLSYLQNGKKYSIRELAERLEVTPRMVRTYKEDLEKAGFVIETIYGPYGGYVMHKNNVSVGPSFNEYDLEMLKKIETCTANHEMRDYIGTLKNRIEICTTKNDDILKDDLLKIYNVLSRAIKEHRKVKITYDSLNRGLNERTIHPLEIFSFSGNFGVAAFCEAKKDLRHFEFKRIAKIELLGECY